MRLGAISETIATQLGSAPEKNTAEMKRRTINSIGLRTNETKKVLRPKQARQASRVVLRPLRSANGPVMVTPVSRPACCATKTPVSEAALIFQSSAIAGRTDPTTKMS